MIAADGIAALVRAFMFQLVNGAGDVTATLTDAVSWPGSALTLHHLNPDVGDSLLEWSTNGAGYEEAVSLAGPRDPMSTTTPALRFITNADPLTPAQRQIARLDSGEGATAGRTYLQCSEAWDASTGNTHGVLITTDGTNSAEAITVADGTTATAQLATTDGTDTAVAVCTTDGTTATAQLATTDGTDTAVAVCTTDGTTATAQLATTAGADTAAIVCTADTAGRVDIRPSTETRLNGRTAHLLVGEGLAPATANLTLTTAVTAITGAAVTLTLKAGDVVHITGIYDFQATTYGVNVVCLGYLLVNGAAQPAVATYRVAAAVARSTVAQVWRIVIPSDGAWTFQLAAAKTLAAGSYLAYAWTSTVTVAAYGTK